MTLGQIFAIPGAVDTGFALTSCFATFLLGWMLGKYT